MKPFWSLVLVAVIVLGLVALGYWLTFSVRLGSVYGVVLR